VIDLCDAVLGLKGLCQHRFFWLRGDPPPKTGRPAREATTPTRRTAVSNVAHLLVEAVAQTEGATRHEDRCIMTIPVQQSLAGFIASDADVSFTDAGITRVHFRAGVEHWRREHDRTFTKLDNSFHDLLIFGKTAERAAARFRKGDQFVAHGYVDTRPAEPPARPSEVFIARKIGHDLARTAYDVNRTPATARQDPHHLEQAAVGATAPPPHDAQRTPTTPPAGAPHATAPRSGTSPRPGIGL